MKEFGGENLGKIIIFPKFGENNNFDYLNYLNDYWLFKFGYLLLII